MKYLLPLLFFLMIHGGSYCQVACVDSAKICDTCACPLIDFPVCGCNGKTYINSCYAKNAGLLSWTTGACTSTGYENTVTPTMYIRLYPNPTGCVTELDFTIPQAGGTEIRVANILGVTLYRTNLFLLDTGLHSCNLNLESLSNGIYFVEIIMNNSIVGARKLLKD